MKSGDTIRIRPYGDKYESSGLLPVPPLARLALAGSITLGLAAIGLIGAMLGWW